MRPAAELLLIEAKALPAVLAGAEPAHFDRPTICDGWSVRDVLAHCAAALTDLVRGDIGGFTSEENQRAVDERSAWPVHEVVAELVNAYPSAARIIDQVGGAADGLALGEWIHGGDVREPLGAPDPYASDGVDLAIELVTQRARDRAAPAVRVEVAGTEVGFGSGDLAGVLRCDTAATFIRLVSGRAPDPDRYTLTGAVTVADLLLFR